MTGKKDCAWFGEALSSYLDGELTKEQTAAFLGHAKDCAACGESLDSMTRLCTMCAELDEGLSMPLDAQAAWRNAVREEAAQRKRRRPWLRTANAWAAALVLLLGGAMVFSQLSPLSLNTSPKEQSFGAVIGSHFTQNAAQTKGISPTAVLYDMEDAEPLLMADGAMDEVLYEEDSDALTSEGAGAGVDAQQRGERKLLRTASRDMQSAQFDDDLARIKDLITEYDGLIEDGSEYGQPLQSGEQFGRRAYLNVRVPAEQLDDFLSALNFGTITARNDSQTDVSKEYYDASAQLDSYELLLGRYQDLILQAESFADVMEAERQIAKLQLQIDELTGTLKAWDSQIELSSVSISLTEVPQRDAVTAVDSKSLGERIRLGFFDSINLFMMFMQDALVLLVLIAPELLVLVIAAWIIIAIVRRKRRG